MGLAIQQIREGESVIEAQLLVQAMNLAVVFKILFLKSWVWGVHSYILINIRIF